MPIWIQDRGGGEGGQRAGGGFLAGAGGVPHYSTPRSSSRIGGSQDDTYYGPNTRFAGTLGVVIVLPTVVEADTMARIHAWAQGRFGVR